MLANLVDNRSPAVVRVALSAISTPEQPCSSKGRLRAELARELLAMSDSGQLRVAIGRASDFFGPHAPQAAAIRDDVVSAIAQGKPAYLMGSADTPHSYSYIPDVACGLAVLGCDDAAQGRVWHLPVASADLTTRELLGRIADEAGTRLVLRTIPNWLQRTIGVFVPLFSAVAEMKYQWDVPFVLDDSDFRRTFGVEPTPLDAAARATLAGRSVEGVVPKRVQTGALIS